MSKINLKFEDTFFQNFLQSTSNLLDNSNNEMWQSLKSSVSCHVLIVSNNASDLRIHTAF